jgi:hypothetical protein
LVGQAQQKGHLQDLREADVELVELHAGPEPDGLGLLADDA